MQTNNSDKKTILQILPALNSGGVERGTIDIARAIVDNGWQSLVASAGGKMINQVKSVGATHIELPLATKNPFKILKNKRRIIDIIKKYNVDIVHARSRAPAWSCYLACKELSEQNHPVKFITTFHGTYKNQNPLKKLYNSVMVKSIHVIAVSEFIKKHIIDNYGLYSKNITVIHRGVDVEYFNSDNIKSARTLEAASKLRLPDDVPIILLPGRITNWKGQLFLLKSLTRLSHKNYYCLIIGAYQSHMSYYNKLKKFIKKNKLQQNVRIMEDVSDIATIYKMSDIIISSSLRPEAFGRIAIEGQAMGRLVIATNHGGSCETIINNKTGWLVDVDDTKKMADAIENAIGLTKDERKLIYNAAIENIQNNFTLKQMCDNTINLYSKILSE
ncbi:MAG: glycosyltransferase family 4 protein [Pseudomonadota bacterium]